MRRSGNWNYVEKKDKEFWVSVHYLVPSLLRVFGIPMIHASYQRPVDGDVRIISYPQQQLPGITLLYDFFWRSPDCFIPLKSYVCQVGGFTPPIAFGKRELLVMLWQLSKGSKNEAFITKLYRKLDPIFLQGDDIEWDKATIMATASKSKLPVVEAKTQLELVYTLWVQYIKRHYDHALLGRTDEERLNTQMICVDALRNHLKPNTLNPPARSICDALALVDDTLCFKGKSNPAFQDFPGSVMNQDLLDWFMSHGRYPGTLRKDIIKILRLHQKILIQKNRAMGKSEQTPCFRYWDNSTEYPIFYQRDIGKYRYRADRKMEPTFAMKNIVFQRGKDEDVSSSKDCLYQLLGGSQEGLCELAKLTAHGLCEQKLFQGVVVLSIKQARKLHLFLSLVSGHSVSSMDWSESMRDLSKKSAMDELIEMKIEGQPFAFSHDDGKQLNPEQWIRLRKIFSGVHITSQDAILGRKKHKNTVQWLVIGNDQTVQKLRSHGIKVNQLSFSLNSVYPSFKASPWVQQILPLWGYLQLQTKKENEQSTTFRTIQLFMNGCCQLTKKEVDFIPAMTLYNGYTAYCKAQGREDILKFKDFNDVLETTYGLKRIRHHYTDGKNPTGFNRIIFTASEQVANSEQHEPPSPKALFLDKLEQMEREVREHFDKYPF